MERIMNSIQLKAMGKINLGLDVMRRRPDGYHEVKMVMQTVNLYDRVGKMCIRDSLKTNAGAVLCCSPFRLYCRH